MTDQPFVELSLETIDELFHARATDPMHGRYESRSGLDQLMDEVGTHGTSLRIEIELVRRDAERDTADTIRRALLGVTTTRLAALGVQRRRVRRLGLKELAFGLAFLALCMAGAGTLATLDLGPSWVRDYLLEGVIIVGWIALWHPVDMLFFEPVPLIRDQRILRRIQQADLRIRDSGGRASSDDRAVAGRGE